MEDPLITIARFDTAMNANLAKAKLEASGIPAFVMNENGGLFSHAPGDVELCVNESNEDEALRVLGAQEPTAAAEPEVDWRVHEEAERCPVCESSLVEIREPSALLRVLRMLASVVLPLPDAMMASRRRACGVCGYQWKEGELGVTRVPTIDS